MTTRNKLAVLLATMVLAFLWVTNPVVADAARLLTGRDIQNDSVTSADIRNDTLRGKDVRDKSLTKADFRGSITGPQGTQGPTGEQGPAGARGPGWARQAVRRASQAPARWTSGRPAAPLPTGWRFTPTIW